MHTKLKSERQRQCVALRLSGCTDVRHYSLQVSSRWPIPCGVVCICISAVGVFLVKKMFLAVENVVVVVVAVIHSFVGAPPRHIPGVA